MHTFPGPSSSPCATPNQPPYTGDLSIFDNAGRAERLQINSVMDTLEIVPGKSVADIGAGSGFFTVLASRRVGDQGMVYAEDINPEYACMREHQGEQGFGTFGALVRKQGKLLCSHEPARFRRHDEIVKL